MNDAYLRVPPELAHTLAVVVDAGSLEAAAALLGVTQPAVSQRLRTLEKVTGHVLLVRSRPVRATAAGLAVVEHGRRLAQLDGALAQSLGLGSSLALPLGVNADSLATWLLEPLARLTTALGITVDLHRDDEDWTHRLLAEGRVVAAVTTRADPVPGCTVTPLGVLEYRAVAHPEFIALHLPDGPTALALEAAPVVDFDARDDLQTNWLNLMGARADRAPRHRVPASSEFALAIALGMGWGLLPGTQRALYPQLIELGGPSVLVPLYWQQWRVHSGALDSLARGIVSAARLSLLPLAGPEPAAT